MMSDMNGPAADSLDRETRRKLIADAIAELNLRQIAITRRLTPAQRCQEALSMILLAEHALRSRRAPTGCASGDRS